MKNKQKAIENQKKLISGYLFIPIVAIILSFITECILPLPLNAAETNRVRAKIGVQVSGDRIMKAKSKERLKIGDSIRIYVHSETSNYIYIVHNDGNNASLLNITEQKIQSSTLILPSAQSFYVMDDKSSMEKFTIICAPEKIHELSVMENKNITCAEWQNIEASLQKQSMVLNSEDDDQPFLNNNVASIAGNVRGGVNNIKTSSGANDDPFLKELQIFSGNGLVIKTYEFQIKK